MRDLPPAVVHWPGQQPLQGTICRLPDHVQRHAYARQQAGFATGERAPGQRDYSTSSWTLTMAASIFIGVPVQRIIEMASLNSSVFMPFSIFDNR